MTWKTRFKFWNLCSLETILKWECRCASPLPWVFSSSQALSSYSRLHPSAGGTSPACVSSFIQLLSPKWLFLSQAWGLMVHMPSSVANSWKEGSRGERVRWSRRRLRAFWAGNSQIFSNRRCLGVQRQGSNWVHDPGLWTPHSWRGGLLEETRVQPFKMWVSSRQGLL